MINCKEKGLQEISGKWQVAVFQASEAAQKPPLTFAPPLFLLFFAFG
jgi:hypothetical protein